MNQPRAARLPFNMSAITLVGSVPIEEIPPGTHILPGHKRRWEALGETIRERSKNGEALVISVPSGNNAETVRQGIATELERFELRSRVRSVTEKDGSITLYLVAIPKA